MENEIILPQDVVSGGLTSFDQQTFDAVSKSGDFLPRLQLFGGNSDAVKAEIIPIAHYGLVHDAQRIDDLGVQVDVAVVSWRPKAMRLGDEVFSYFNINNPEFAKVQAESGVQDSGCMYGPEFLCWLPAKGVFVTFYMGSKTARREAPRLLPLLGKAATLKSKLIKTARYSWHGPVVTPCTTPLAVMPDLDDLKDELDKFKSPVDSVVEKVDPANVAARER